MFSVRCSERSASDVQRPASSVECPPSTVHRPPSTFRDKGLAGKSALELAEEAFHLLRQAPARVLAFYAIGAVPFVLGFLYFWADLSRSAYAADHAVAAALGVSA